jgi:hypothetical protein
VKPLERLRVRWAWRRRRFALPARQREEAAPYGYALPRQGAAPALVVAIAVLAIAAGGWLGTQTGGGGATETGPLLGLEPAAAADARDTIDALSTARADGRRDLATAATPSEQAAAAVALRRSYVRAATEIRGSEPAVERALRRTAGAYGALSRAAERRDRRAYARASTAVASAERDLERLIGSIL